MVKMVQTCAAGGRANSVSESIEKRIRARMVEKLSEPDISNALGKMAQIKIKLPRSLAPMTENELLNARYEDLIWNEEGKEVNVVECRSYMQNGSTYVEWCFALAALSEDGSGEDLIMKAIDDAISYAGLRERSNVLTAFTSENDAHAGEFRVYDKKFSPNPNKSFDMRSAICRSRETSMMLMFNDLLIQRSKELNKASFNRTNTTKTRAKTSTTKTSTTTTTTTKPTTLSSKGGKGNKGKGKEKVKKTLSKSGGGGRQSRGAIGADGAKKGGKSHRRLTVVEESDDENCVSARSLDTKTND